MNSPFSAQTFEGQMADILHEGSPSILVYIIFSGKCSFAGRKKVNPFLFTCPPLRTLPEGHQHKQIETQTADRKLK